MTFYPRHASRLFITLILAFIVVGCTAAPAQTPTPSSSPSPSPTPGTTLYTGTDGYPWWNDTVFYEIFVRSFYDSNGDGIGDFIGLPTQPADEKPTIDSK